MRLKLRVNESQREISHQYDQEIPIMIYADAANKCRKLISGANVLNGDQIYRIGFKLQIGHYVSDFLVCHAVLLDDHNQSKTKQDVDGSISSAWINNSPTRCVDFLVDNASLEMHFFPDAVILPLDSIILSLYSEQSLPNDMQATLNSYFSNERIVQQGSVLQISADNKSCKLRVSECYPGLRGFTVPEKTTIALVPTVVPLSRPLTFKEPHGLTEHIASWTMDDETVVLIHILPFLDESILKAISTSTSPNYVALASEACMINLGMFDGNWIAISTTHSPTWRLFQLFSAKSIPDSSNAIYLLPEIHSLLTSPSPTKSNLSYMHLIPENFLPGSLPVCQSVQLSRIASPASNTKFIDTLAGQELQKWLTSHANGMRLLLTKGDIINVQLTTQDIQLQRLGDMVISEWRDSQNVLSASENENDLLVQFKIARIHGTEPREDLKLGTYRFDSKTRVLLEGAENSCYPQNSHNSFTQSRLYTQLRSLFQICRDPEFLTRPMLPFILIHGRPKSGKRTNVHLAARQTGFHVFEIDCFQLKEDSWTKTMSIFQIYLEKTAASAPCILLLTHLQAFLESADASTSPSVTAIKNMIHQAKVCFLDSVKQRQLQCTLVVTVDDIDRVPSALNGLFTNELAVMAPDEDERYKFLLHLSAKYIIYPSVDLQYLAHHTAGFVFGDLIHLFDKAMAFAISRVRRDVSSVLVDQTSDPGLILQCAGAGITSTDVSKALAESKAAQSELLKAPKIPNVQWEDIGGLSHVKHAILETIQLPMRHPELFASGVKKRSGVLLYGPPGTGKTLVAKAVATTLSLNFFSVKGPELLNMYIGESEANVRRVFARAREAKPCVVFFDELDSVAPKRGEKGDSGGVMDRIVSQLLAELDGMADGGSSDVFVIGATNRPDLLDPALLRPGRFDKLLYLGVPSTNEAQLNVLHALTRKFKLCPDIDLHEIAKECDFTLTGADFYALCSDALLKAMLRKIHHVDKEVEAWNVSGKREGHPHPIDSIYYLEHIALNEDIQVEVKKIDFQDALADLTPSVTADELAHYQQLQASFAPK